MDLPLDIGVFSTIIENNYIYVDKTKFIYELYRPGGKYFLSRPRRFGKSLLLRTMKELFKGSESLFKGLYIYDKWDWTKIFPVIELDLGNVSRHSPDILEDSLNTYLMTIAEEYEIELIRNDLAGRFSELIKKIYKSTGKKLVFLVDEYDKPIIDNIKDYYLSESNLKVLSNFYGVLKSNEEFIEFIFLTGVTKLDKIFDFVGSANLRFAKFSKTSIFSGLNNVTDITVDPKFANICDYTQQDLETCFSRHLVKLSKVTEIPYDKLLDLIKNWYNGYSWDGEKKLYNPYSILSLFEKDIFRNYWFETATPSFLIDIIKNNPEEVTILFKESIEISGNFPTFYLENLDLTTLLLQTGYLTIKNADIVEGELKSYDLAIPNKEVNISLFTSMIGEFSKQSSKQMINLGEKISQAITNLDNNALQAAFDTLIATIPSVQYGKVKKDIREANYHILLLSWFRLMGFFALGETPFSKRIPDIIIKKDNLVVICEIKHGVKDLNDLAMESINQIKDYEYYKPFLDYDVVLLGLGFGDREVKTVLEPLEK